MDVYDVNAKEIEMRATIKKFTDHVDEESLLSKTELWDELQIFFENAILLKVNCEILGEAFDLIDKYEEKYDPLFISDKTKNGFERDWETDDDLELERTMLYVQQAIIDGPYQKRLPFGSSVEAPLQNCEEQINGYKWETSNYYPGGVDPPSDPSVEYTIQLNATMTEYFGMPVCFDDLPILRTTGLYLSPGGVATVEVPPELIDTDYKVQVGASTVDNSNKNKHKRNDRITSKYEIRESITYVANPLGGGIYIEVPYLADLGVVTVKITGDVVEAPIFGKFHYYLFCNCNIKSLLFCH